ncbi:MAG: N-glycosylase/DNA lyase [Thermoplasmata archaeon]
MSATGEEVARLKSEYARLKAGIDVRLAEFRALWDSADDATIFRELVFCLFTPQSKARSCWAAVERVCDCDLLLKGSAEEISEKMSGVRFHHTKARRAVEARKYTPGFKNRIAAFPSPFEAREWLVANVSGMSYKEASHFLRNIGMGGELAILDRHILRNLVRLGVITEMPKSLSPKKYLEIEASMPAFSEDIGIPLAHLDMLLWHRETGEIFK